MKKYIKKKINRGYTNYRLIYMTKIAIKVTILK